MSLDQETIDQQHKLLGQQRRRLALLFEQQAKRASGVEVEDVPNDLGSENSILSSGGVTPQRHGTAYRRVRLYASRTLRCGLRATQDAIW